MKHRARKFDHALWLHGTLTASCCVLAWLAWSRPNLLETSAGVAVLTERAATAQALVWHDATGSVEVRRDGNDVCWVAVQAAGEAAAKIYPATTQARSLFAKLVPLVATRKMGAMTPAQLQAAGLQPAKASLTFAFADHTTTLDVGADAWGNGELFVRNQAGAIFLVRPSLLTGFSHGGMGLQDHALVALPRRTLARVTLQAHGHSRTFVQRNPEDASAAYFADAASPDHKLAGASTFFDQLLRLRAVDVQAQAPTQAPDIVVTLEDVAQASTTLELFDRTPAPLGRSTRLQQTAVLQPSSSKNLFEDVLGVLAEGL